MVGLMPESGSKRGFRWHSDEFWWAGYI